MDPAQSRVDKLSPFQHKPLQHHENIRLLCLHPGHYDEPVECTLYETRASLEFDEYKYNALSYVWGDAELSHAISCNGQKMMITQNLHSALRRIRQESEEAMFWVDALCIDQSTSTDAVRERARQIGMMHIIFKSAEAVIVDMGEADEDTPLLLANLELFEQHPLETWDKPLEFFFEGSIVHTKIPGLKRSFWKIFLSFLQRPWSRRVWMFQEYILAQHIVFLLGTNCILEDLLAQCILPACDLFLKILNYGRRLDLGGVTFSEAVSQLASQTAALRSRLYMRQQHQSSATEMFTLATLMQKTYWLEASILQDKVYALLPLTAAWKPTNFPVLYTESSEDTALRLSLLLLEQCPLFLLYRCVGVESDQASWTMTLEKRPVDTLQSTWEPGGLNLWFRACGDSSLSVSPNRADLLITARGILIGTVSSVTLIWHPTIEGSYEDIPKDLYAPFRDVSAWVEEKSVSASRRYTPEDFWRTLVADLVTKDRRAYRTRQFVEFPHWMTAFTRYIFDYVRENETPEQRTETNKLAKEASPYAECLTAAIGRRLAVLESGVPCLVPGKTCTGDVVCILTGAPLPLVLRPSGDSFRIVGCCYIHEMMDGQLFENEDKPPHIVDITIR